MITIKWIPNILDDKGRETKIFDYIASQSVADYIAMSGFDVNGNRVIVSGKQITDFNVSIVDGDEIIITPEIRDGENNGSIIGAVITTVLGIATSNPALVMMGLMGLTQAMATRPNYGTASVTGNFQESSPTYSWNGIQTTQDVGLPVPIVYGEHRIGGNIINLFVDANKQYEYIYQAISAINETASGYVNTFRTSEAIKGIKFNLNSYSHTFQSSNPYDTQRGFVYSYIIEYKLASDSTWTLYGSVGSGYYALQGLNFVLELAEGIYDFRITLGAIDNLYPGDCPKNTRYYSGLCANIKRVSTTRTDDRVANMLISLCEGEIESIENININDNPINNYREIEVSRRFGTNNQGIIPNFNDLENIYGVNTQLLKDVPYIYTTQDNDVEAFELIFHMPNGLYAVDDNGNISSWQIMYKVEYKLHSDSVYSDLGTFTISNKTRTTSNKIFRKDSMAAGQYDIKVTKVSNDSDFNHIGDLYIQSIGEIKNDDLVYPNTALLGIKVLATEQLSGTVPKITAVVKGRKVSQPKIMYDSAEVLWEDYYYDSATSQYKRFEDDAVCTWDGTTYVDRWTANPVWCLRDLLTNTRYGLGEFIDGLAISDPDFILMSQYCDEKISDGNGGYEKRHRIDIVIDGTGKAVDLITQMCSTFHGFAFYSGGYIKIKIDRAEVPVQLFGMGNIIAGSFSQSWKSKKDVPNVIEVSYLDSEKDYMQETIAVIDEDALAAGEPMRKQSVQLFVTRSSYALRAGRYALKNSKYVNRTVNFKVAIEAVACQAGDLISVAHDVPQWGMSGRIKSGSSTTLIKLDRTVTIENAKTYKLRVRFADDTIVEKTVSDSAGNYTQLHVSEAFSQVPGVYDVYSFGESTKVKKDFRIISMTKQGEHEVEISAVEYNENVFDDSAVIIPSASQSMLRVDVPDVTDLWLTERIVKQSDGRIEDVIDIWFNKPVSAAYNLKPYAKARIYISDDSGKSWAYKGETNDNNYSIVGGIVDLVSYTIAVVSVDDFGREKAISASPQATIQIIGKKAPPTIVAGFSVMKDGSDIVFSWAPNSDVDIFGYEIREGDSWDRGTIVATNVQSNICRMPVYAFGELRYMIKAIDTTGNYSLSEAVHVIEITGVEQIVALQSTLLDTWGDGQIVESSENSETVVDDSGDTIVDNAGDTVIQTGLKGFEETVEITDAPVIDSIGNQVTDDEGIPVVYTETILSYLRLKYFGDHYASRGIYISKKVNLGSIVRARLVVNVNYSGSDCAYNIYIRTSLDNATWEDWQLYAPGEHTCRYYQIKFEMINNNTDVNASLFNITGHATIYLIEDNGNDVNVVNSSNITFNKAFYNTVNLQVIAQGAKYARVTAKSLTGFTVEVRADGTGALTTGAIDWKAKGY